MAHETQGRPGASSENISEQELQELGLEQFQNEIEGEEESDIEAEATPDEIASEAWEHIEAGEHPGLERHPQLRHAVITRIVVRSMLKATLIYTRAVVKHMLRNAALRRRLLAATRRGPRSLRAFLAPAVLRSIPRPFRRASRRLLPLMIVLAFRSIARQTGLSAHEADAAECESEST